MGLAYPALSQAFSASLPFTLYQQRQGGRPEWFALSLRSQGTSQITFGGYNRARTGGGLRWFNVKLEDGAQFRTYWQIGASAAYVNGVQASSRVNMILDSGTTLIIVRFPALFLLFPMSEILTRSPFTCRLLPLPLRRSGRKSLVRRSTTIPSGPTCVRLFLSFDPFSYSRFQASVR